MPDLELAVAPMHRLCKKAGADRVSEAAAKELAKALEAIGVKIAFFFRLKTAAIRINIVFSRVSSARKQKKKEGTIFP